MQFQFTTVPRDALKSLLHSYSLYGEGWGVDLGQVEEIFNNAPYMVDSIGYTDEDLKNLFLVFDTDQNGLIDALEMLITLALVSGMDVVDKLQFAFSIYDFDYSGMLSKEEVSLLVRSSVKGLCKVSISLYIYIYTYIHHYPLLISHISSIISDAYTHPSMHADLGGW